MTGTSLLGKLYSQASQPSLGPAGQYKFVLVAVAEMQKCIKHTPQMRFLISSHFTPANIVLANHVTQTNEPKGPEGILCLLRGGAVTAE